jgi:hypothetical protein
MYLIDKSDFKQLLCPLISAEAKLILNENIDFN